MDDAAAGLCYTGSPENHRYTDRVTVKYRLDFTDKNGN